MPTEPPTAAESSYYWTASLLAVVTALATGIAIWRTYLTEEDREAVRRRLGALIEPVLAVRRRTKAQNRLVYELLLATEALDRYPGDDDLTRLLAVA